MAYNTEYTRFTYQELIEDFQTRLHADERFKNLSAASIYQMFMEMLTGTMDETNYFMQRVAEEGFLDTARLDSSVIKHAKTLGYSPIRQTPAECEVAIKIKGPLPKGVTAGATVYFSQEDAALTFNNYKFMLKSDYSYTFDEQDIIDGQSSTWSKTLVLAKNASSMKYWTLGGIKMYNSADAYPIRAFQGEIECKEIRGIANQRKLGKNYQYYDVDDVEWSNWYGKRDPSAYERNQYRKENGFAKVGIGQSEDEALRDDNLYDIEDCSIYLNDNVQSFKDSDASEPLKVCCITSNQDKTMRVQFGDGTIVNGGLLKETDNLYVRYLKTKGAIVNTIGTTGSVFSTAARFFATQPNGVIDVTQNIQFIINSDITGGTDFESSQSIKNNAPKYYAAAGRLITEQDFISWFSAMTSPVKVKNANAWGQEEIEELFEGGSTTYKYLQNIICYAIAASAYNINGKINGVRNVLDEDDDTFGAFTVYGSGSAYLAHLVDYLKMLISFNSFCQQQYEKNPSKQWLKNIKKIRQDIAAKLIMNSKIFSMPPFVQYYDVVGSVEIDSLSKMSSYKREVENQIYEWLDENAAFGKPIFKADILKFFTKRDETKAVNLDIKVSELVKGQENVLTYNISNKSFTQVYSLNKNLPGAPTYNNTGNNVNYNVITLPNMDSNGNQINANSLRNKNIKLRLYAYNSADKKTDFRNEIQFTPYDVAETGENIVISMYGYQQRSKFDIINNQTAIYLYVTSNDDFASTSNFSTANAASYGLTPAQVADVQADLKEWIHNAVIVHEADRAIALPYFIETMDEITRQETITRVGAIQNQMETELTEKSFWQYMVPKLISKYYYASYADMNEEDVDGELWTHITNLAVDIYKLLKVTLCDSVLDDNNNIVNFSMSNELPVVRLNITYKYRS